MFSRNTDCYQPLERKFGLTHQCLEVFLKFRQPVGLTTKNSFILRDLDILQALAEKGLVHVFMTITTLDKELRRLMEPRTFSGLNRLKTLKKLSEAGLPTGVMLDPVIPRLNNHEVGELMEKSAEAGALTAGYTFVRLNGAVGNVFENWIWKALPDGAEKVLHQIREAHGGEVNDNRFGKRMRGEGPMAEGISRLFKILKKKYFEGRSMPPNNCDDFRIPPEGQLSLF